MTQDSLLGQLNAYKRKYYLNRLLRGGLLSLALVLVYYLGAAVVEYYGNLSTGFRAGLFFGFVAVALAAFIYYLAVPLARLLRLGKPLSDEEAARQIGKYFPEVKDKLLNTLQLRKLDSGEGSLLHAALQQKTRELSVVPFASAIKYSENRRYLRYLVPPALVLVVLLMFIPQLFVESTRRIINYDQHFEPKAPFSFHLANDTLEAFANEDYTVELNIEGQAMPEQVYLINRGRARKMEGADGRYTFTMPRLQGDEAFQFEAAGFRSQEYKLTVRQRPSLTGFGVKLDYPRYLGKKNEVLNNAGNLSVPVGTQITWEFSSAATDSLTLHFEQDQKTLAANKAGRDFFSLGRRIMASTAYQVRLRNRFAAAKEEIKYNIEVIPDQYPTITAEQYQDSALYNYLLLGGAVADDYGLTRLELHYLIRRKGSKDGAWQRMKLRLPAGQTSQNFVHQWQLDSLKLQPGDGLDYYVSVWDNDGVHGPKASKTRTMQFNMPGAAQIEKTLNANAEKAEAALDKSLQQAKQMEKEVKKMRERMRSKRNLDYQDKKALEQLLKQHEELKQQIDQMKQQNQQLNQQQQRFDQQSEKLAEKMEELKKLMEELLDDETKKLYEKLQQLLEEKQPNNDRINEVLERLERKEDVLNKELDRSLEIFKQLRMEQKMEQTINKLQEMAKQQEELAKETADKKNGQDNADQQKKQDELNKMFEEAKDDLQKLQEMNKELEDPKDMPQTGQDQQDVEKEQQQSSQNLQKKDNKQASKNQKQAADKMKQMAQRMQDSMKEGEQEEQAENMEDLRVILENLLRLSFDQEELMTQFRNVYQSDPRVVAMGQQQLKLRDDAKIIEDSLYALAKRVVQIQSFITRELSQMTDYMDQSVGAIKQRYYGQASGKQQLAMTSINNLALLLSDVLKQMQEQMAQSQPKSGKGKPNKKKGQGQGPSMSQLQKQLSERIQKLQQSGKQGRELSEELAKLAAEQEALRRAMQKQQNGKGGSGGSGGTNQDKNGKEQPGGEKKDGKQGSGDGKLQELMEQNEKDLVNKRLSQELINRQKEIMTRLLEAENSMREREFDEKRESKTAQEMPRKMPPSFEQYLKQKQQQVEMLKTIPPGLTPFYRNEANRYLQSLGKQ